MRRVASAVVIFIALIVFTAPLLLAEDRDHLATLKERHRDHKVFVWGENRAGECHQVNAILVIRSDGTASFDADTWTRTHWTDVWNSIITLYGRGDIKMGETVQFRSPGMKVNADGPGHLYHNHFDFTFPPEHFRDIIKAVEHSGC
jgi:hypothetical protein